MNLDQKRDRYFELVNKIFPELRLASSFSIYGGDYPTSADIKLGNQSTAFKNKFQFSNTFIHYTSIEALMNIFNSQELRLFNCDHLNDPQELKYSAKQLNIRMSEEEIEEFRRSFFILSAAEYDLANPNDDFNLWRLYGSSGYGAAIVFEIENYTDKWDEIFYGKVNYGTESHLYKDFIDFIKIHQDFNHEYKMFQNIPSLIPAIALHYKDLIWAIENEIRLIAYCPFDKWNLDSQPWEHGNPYLSNTIKHTINSFGNAVAYTSLPITLKQIMQNFSKIIGEEDAAKYLSCIPQLKIRKVILGHNVAEKVFHKIEELCFGYFSKIIGYTFEVAYSSFKK